MNGNVTMAFGLLLDIIGICMLWQQFDARKFTSEDREKKLPDVSPEKEFILVFAPRSSEIGIWQLTINLEKTEIGFILLILGLMIQILGVWLR